MKFLENYKNFSLYSLDKETAEKYQNEILEMLNLIPKANYKFSDIVAEKKGERNFFEKWNHSLIVFDRIKNIPVGILIGYEREKESNCLYKENCFYINEIAINPNYQGYGIGKYLMEYFIKSKKDFLSLSGDLIFKIQTEDSFENKKVIDFYKSLGFKEIGKKEYPSKFDLVLELKK